MTKKRKLSAREVLQDIHAGLDDISMMEKYGLSSMGLQSLFSKLLRAGLISPEEFDDRMMPFLGTMTIDESMEVFATPMKSLEAEIPPPPPPTPKKTRPPIKASELVADIRAGLSDAELMEKYSLSAKALQSVFNLLVQRNAVTREELEKRQRPVESTVDVADLTGGREFIEAAIRPIRSRVESESEHEIIPDFGPSDSSGDLETGETQAGDHRDAGERESLEPPVERTARTVEEVEPRRAAPIGSFDNPFMVILLLVVLPPLGLWALYRSKALSPVVKLGILVAFLLLVCLSLVLLNSLF